MNSYEDCSLDTPVKELPEEAVDEIFNGVPERLRVPAAIAHTTDDLYVEFNGLADYILHMADADMSAASRRWAEQFSYETTCALPRRASQ